MKFLRNWRARREQRRRERDADKLRANLLRVSIISTTMKGGKI